MVKYVNAKKGKKWFLYCQSNLFSFLELSYIDPLDCWSKKLKNQYPDKQI